MDPSAVRETRGDGMRAGDHPEPAPAAVSAPGPDGTAPAGLVELLWQRVVAGAEEPAAVDALGGRRWTWGGLAAAALETAAAFEAAGLRPGDRLAHDLPHSIEWIAVDLACLLTGVVHVALHADAGPRHRADLLAWLAPRGLLGGRHAVPGREGGRPILIDPAVVTAAVAAAEAGGRDRQPDRADVGAALRDRASARDPDACCAIVLSSGTTGRPHGVCHSQRALAFNAWASSGMFLTHPHDVRLAWLPQSHAVARTGDLYTALVRGSCLNVVADRRRLLDACRALPPTAILGVPAFFERLERGVESGAIGDLAAALGGAVRVCISGGAPLKARTAECFAARGVPLVEGYGLAEAGPVVTLANPRTARPGLVGLPLPGVDLRLDDRPASRGQLLVRTPSRALGVLDGPAAAPPRPADEHGWLATGDLAEFAADGQVRITGRLGETLVLSTGVKLPPEEVERALGEDDAVAQVCVVGAGLAWPVALVVPEPAVLRAAIRRLRLRVFSRRQALRHPRLVHWLARRLARRQAALPRAWRVRRVALVGRPFTAARGEATDSFKLRRRVIAEHFQGLIAAAAAADAPRGVAVMPGDDVLPQPEPRAGRAALAAALWHGHHGGFATAAERVVRPPASEVEAVVETAVCELARLRREGRLYDAPAGGAPPAAPLADAPPPPPGLFSPHAEAALGATGLWGLAVPREFGGAGASLHALGRAITRLACDVPTAAGMLAVHSAIGAVSALTAFGSPAQQQRHLPGLAAGRPLSIFGGTEPDAGCDLHAVQTRLEPVAGRLLLTGTKMFITNATHGRLVKLLATHAGRPAVLLVRLPDADTPQFRLRRYALHPLKHAHNAALEFSGFPVDEADLLAPPAGGDGMPIVWHGLNRGRVLLAAQAAGTLRILLRHAAAHARGRRTWGAAIATRELVQARLGRIAAAAVACDALSAWAATAIDSGQSGELEAIVAKTAASGCVRDAALDALGVHGGRAFLVGHPLGDALHDHLAVTVYEGESELLGLALFKGLAKHHPLVGSRGAVPRAAGWLAWRVGALTGRGRPDAGVLDGALHDHARRARRLLDHRALAIDRAIRRHGRAVADRQLLMGTLAAAVRDLASVIAVAHHADAAGDEMTIAAADCWCRLALARAAGRHPSAADQAALVRLGRAVVAGAEPAVPWFVDASPR